MSKKTAPELNASIVIAAPPNRILKAFFEPDALSAWWQVEHAVTTPRMLGPYAIEWPPTEFRDDVLGRLQPHELSRYDCRRGDHASPGSRVPAARARNAGTGSACGRATSMTAP